MEKEVVKTIIIINENGTIITTVRKRKETIKRMWRHARNVVRSTWELV